MDALLFSSTGWEYSVEPIGVSATKRSWYLPVRPAGKWNWASRVPRLIDFAGEEWPRIFVWHEQLNPHRPGLGDVVIVCVCDDDPDRGFASGKVLRLAEDVHDGPAKNLRDGRDALDRRSLIDRHTRSDSGDAAR